MEETRRLYRSEEDRMLAGICGGLAEYLDVDPTVIRILFVVAGILGWGAFLYLVMWLLVPARSKVGAEPREIAEDAVREARDSVERGAEEVRGAVERMRRPTGSDG